MININPINTQNPLKSIGWSGTIIIRIIKAIKLIIPTEIDVIPKIWLDFLFNLFLPGGHLLSKLLGQK